MSNAVSALLEKEFDGPLKVRDAGLRGMITLRADLGDPKFGKDFVKALGAKVPDMRRMTQNKAVIVAWMSPDELLILCKYDEVSEVIASLDKALKGIHYLAVNVSDARAVLSLEGTGWRDVLAKLTPADVSSTAFGPDEMRRSRLAQVAGAFWISGENRVEVICFRSVATYVFDLLQAAVEGGTVGHLRD
jgi:sarcosine oxidase subunit gamma